MAAKRRVSRTKKHRKHVGHHLLGTYGTIAIAVVSVGALLGSAFLSSTYLGSGSMAAVISSTLVSLTNTDRATQNLGTLTVNPELTAAAQAKADDMAAKSYFAHTSPDGKTSWYWFKEAGYSFTYAGENLAVDFSDSDAVENAWMNSPTHRANILNGHYTEIGIASAEGTYEGHHTIFVVQMFGAPAHASTGSVVAENPSAPATETAVAKTEPAPVTKTPAPKPITIVPASTTATATPTVAGAESSPPAPAAPASSPFLLMLAAAPVATLRDLYLIVGAIVLVALVSITGLEFKKHHMRYVFATAFLFVLMASLYLAADHLVFGGARLTAAAASSVE